MPGGGYKALVCFFLNGGNDANNLLMPAGGSARSLYDSGRGVLGIPTAQLTYTPANAANGYFGSSGSVSSSACVDGCF